MLKRTALTGLQIITILAVITLILTSAVRAAGPQPGLGALKLSDRATAQEAGFLKVGYFKKKHGHRGFKKRSYGHKKFGHKRHFGHRKFGHKRKFGHRSHGHRKFGHRKFGHRKFGHGKHRHYSYGHRSYGHKYSGHKYSGHKYSGHGRYGKKKHGHGRYGHGRYGHKPVIIFKHKSSAYPGNNGTAAFTPAVNRFQQNAPKSGENSSSLPKRHHLIAETTAAAKTPETKTSDYGASSFKDTAPKNHGHNFRNKSTRLKDVPKGITRPKPSTQKFDYGSSSFKPGAPKNHGHDFRN